LETFPKPVSWLGMEKQNLTQQKHTFTNQNTCVTTQNKHKKLKPGLVASYTIWPENGVDLFLFWRFINLSPTYLLSLSYSVCSWVPQNRTFGNTRNWSSFCRSAALPVTKPTASKHSRELRATSLTKETHPPHHILS